MKNKTKYVIYTIIALLVIVFLPAFLDRFIFNNSVQSSLNNGEWSSFLGSYIGGVIGGVGTLLAVIITTNETRRIQSSTKAEIETDRSYAKKKERKQFADEIAKIVSEYISALQLYFSGSQRFFLLYNKTYEINSISSEMADELTVLYKQRRMYQSPFEEYKKIENTINEKLLEKSENKEKMDRLDSEIKAEINQMKIDSFIVIENYFLLKIYLNDIILAQDLLIKLEALDEFSERIKQKILSMQTSEIQAPKKTTTLMADNEAAENSLSLLIKGLKDSTVAFCTKHINSLDN